MRKFLKTFHRGEKGFTLIELLVVIAILGALAGIVVLNISQFIGKGKCEGYCTEKHNVVTACVAAMVTDDPSDDFLDYFIGVPKYAPWTITATTCADPVGTATPTGCTCDAAPTT